MNQIKWEDTRTIEEVSASTKLGIGWVLEYVAKDGRTWYLPVCRFIERVYACKDGEKFEVAMSPIPALCDGADFEADMSSDGYDIELGPFRFHGVKYVGESAYIAAYANFIETWPKGEGEPK